jgi:predicted secreted protein
MPTSTPNVKESLPEAENKCVNPAVPALLQPKISKNQPKLLSLPVNLPKKESLMSLVKSASKQAFRKNVKAEIAAGKPPKQAVAIAYNVKRQAQKPKMKKA